ncbi:hypothetical protein RND81_07G016200 [Saponaria officinalis]|uniref:Uncharacterized protein n=1 Tax=Saponaria officinalis TaxID=3572 RepID=A0AAW1JL67_SAPOF
MGKCLHGFDGRSRLTIGHLRNCFLLCIFVGRIIVLTGANLLSLSGWLYVLHILLELSCLMSFTFCSLKKPGPVLKHANYVRVWTNYIASSPTPAASGGT